MEKRIYKCIAMILAMFCMVSPIVHAEVLENLFSISNILRNFSVGDMESMATALPNATIPYRRSNTITCLNNTLTCRAIDGVCNIEGFVQVNNVFPIHWTDVFYIGMDTDTLIEVLNSYVNNDNGESVTIIHTNDRTVELITCLVKNDNKTEESFKIVFYAFNKQVYQIEFAFCE